MIRPASPPVPAPRTGAPVSAALLVALLAPAAAHAQDAGTSTTDNPVRVSFTAGAPDPIGIDDCASALTETRLIELTNNSDSTDIRDPEYRLYYYLGSEPCFVGDGVSDCPGTGTADDDEACGCVEQRTTSSFSFSLDDLAIADLCAEGGPDSVTLIGQIVYPADNDTDELTYEGTDGVTLTFDRIRPGRPTDAPSVAAVEAGLRVRGETVTDADRYEVCVRPYDGTAGASPATGSNEELRGSFATASCRTADSVGGDGYRFTGLANGTPYEVVYAAIDEAGNRGPNSPSNVGTPQPQLDFAEYYTNRLGGQQGEQGGCSSAPGRAPVTPIVLFFLGLAAVVTRARRARHGDRS